MRQVFKLTDVEGKEFPRKKVTGNARNAALRELLQTTAKVTKATVPADAKQLAKDYPSGLLKEALKLRLKQDARDWARTPRLRHFKRDIKGRLAEWNLLYEGSLNESDGRLMWKPHVCVPECGAYNDAETETLLKNDPVNAAEAARYSRA